MAKKINKLLATLSLIAYSLVIIGFLSISYLTFYPRKVIDLRSLEVISNPVKAGTWFKYKLCYSKYLPLSADVTKKLINSTVINYPSSISNNPIGERCDILYEWVPGYAEEAGDYQLSITMIYHPNVFSTKMYTITSNYFQVIKNDCNRKEDKNG